MKHDEPKTAVTPEQVSVALEGSGLVVTDEQCRQLACHANLMLAANEHTNLTRITDPDAVLELHILDSLLVTLHTDALKGLIVDVGSGAGYPGIPLAIVGNQVVLCESVKKKAAFLVSCIAELGLDVAVRDVRAEELAQSDPRIADTVVFRAVSSLAALVELAAPLLKPGGSMVALKGQLDANERSAGRAAAIPCGMEELDERAYHLPGGQSRTVVVYGRVGEARVRLPRRPGMAQRYPLK